MSENQGNDKRKIGRRRLLAGAGAATALGLLGACSREESTKPAEAIPAEEVRQWDLETDVLVAGSGGAGISAAIEARRSGADVVVLERFVRLGGSTGMSGGVCYMGGGTPLQKALGYDDTVEDMYNYIVAAGSKHPHLDKVQLYCEESVEHFHWLVNNGVKYKESFASEKGLPMGDESLYFSGNENVWPWNTMAKPVPRVEQQFRQHPCAGQQ